MGKSEYLSIFANRQDGLNSLVWRKESGGWVEQRRWAIRGNGAAVITRRGREWRFRSRVARLGGLFLAPEGTPRA